MDAVEFIKAWNRMQKKEGKAHCIGLCTVRAPEETVSSVEQWAKEHPIKTRQSVFLEQWPEARIDKTGVLTICPAELTKECRDDRGVCGTHLIETCVCKPCRREFWMQEVE